MKRSIKLIALAFLAAALISQWRRVGELGRQVLNWRREEPASEDVGTVSQPARGVGDATGGADEPESTVRVTPTAERRAGELGIDLSQVEGTGSGGRITVKDVQRAAEKR